MMQYKLTTKDVEIIARPKYMSKESSPKESLYIWVYDIRIENKGSDSVQLLRRHWVITEGDGHIKQVEGPGVVGLQPVLRPAEVFEYSSFCTLSQGYGAM